MPQWKISSNEEHRNTILQTFVLNKDKCWPLWIHPMNAQQVLTSRHIRTGLVLEIKALKELWESLARGKTTCEGKTAEFLTAAGKALRKRTKDARMAPNITFNENKQKLLQSWYANSSYREPRRGLHIYLGISSPRYFKQGPCWHFEPRDPGGPGQASSDFL